MTDHVLLRYAIVGTLLRARRPMTIGEVTAAMRRSRPIDDVVGPMTPKRMSDLLRAQMARGRVRRVERGVYEAVPSAMSRTTQWRYRRWENRFDENARRIASLCPEKGLDSDEWFGW